MRVRLNSFGFEARVGIRAEGLGRKITVIACSDLGIEGPCLGLEWCLDFACRVQDANIFQESG